MLYRLLQDLGKGIIKSRGLLGTCVLGPPVAPTACVTSGKSLPSLSLGFSPVQSKDINFLPSNYPIRLLWEII